MTSIEWTDATWNPVRGCTKISPGCKHCYAEAFAERFRGVAGHPYEQGFDLKLVPAKLDMPLRWRDPKMVFVNSMSDLFQQGIPFEYIAAVYGVMAAADRHRFQVLTKRPGRRRDFFEWIETDRNADRYRHPELIEHAACIAKSDLLFAAAHQCAGRDSWPLPNIWEGVSVEDRKYGVPRIAVLRYTPAAVRFLSIEPLLEDLGELDLRGIDWVIVGAESGRGARTMHDDWVRSIRDQCIAQRVKFFFKQRAVNGRKLSLPVLDGVQWAEFPEVRT